MQPIYSLKLKDLPLHEVGQREDFRISEEEVVNRLRKAKKKPSAVPGDINPRLYDLYPEKMASPITHIFNAIICQSSWPECWKTEHITVIPKISDPQDQADCRNIACTNFLSKLFESFVLKWAREEIKPKSNQYGGDPGASSTQLCWLHYTSCCDANRDGFGL